MGVILPAPRRARRPWAKNHPQLADGASLEDARRQLGEDVELAFDLLAHGLDRHDKKQGRTQSRAQSKSQRQA